MTIRLFLISVFLFFVFVPQSLPGTETEPDARSIVERMDQAMRGDSSYAEMTMRVERPRYTREVSMRAWMKGRDHSLVLITDPPRDRGTAYLMHKNDIWNYDPRIDRTTRLPPSMMAQSWMGSDLTNDDLVRETNIVTDYEHELAGSEKIDDRDVYVIDMTPKPHAAVVWGKVRVWIDMDDYLQLRADHFDQRGDIINTMVFDRITRFGDREIPSRITVLPAGKENEKTVLIYDTVDFDIDIETGFFTRDNMQRLR